MTPADRMSEIVRRTPSMFTASLTVVALFRSPMDVLLVSLSNSAVIFGSTAMSFASA